MAHKHSVRRYRKWYSQLLRLYPRPFYARFGEGMEQTFSDLCRERADAEGKLFGFVLWMLVETSVGIIREEMRYMITQNKNLVRIPLAVALFLLIPLVLTLLSGSIEGLGWHWGPGDFVSAFVLLSGAALTVDFAARRVNKTTHKVAIGVAVGAVVFLIWVELAVDAMSQAVNLLLG